MDHKFKGVKFNSKNARTQQNFTYKNSSGRKLSKKETKLIYHNSKKKKTKLSEFIDLPSEITQNKKNK